MNYCCCCYQILSLYHLLILCILHKINITNCYIIVYKIT
nr:MAG TPA: hypothetical protein [Bacteriophage sp.]